MRNLAPLWLFLLALSDPLLAAKDCGLTSTGKTPLNDLGPGLYNGMTGGLYPNGSNTPPVGHLAAGVEIARNKIGPLDGAGNSDFENGKIVLISVGMSNTTQEFATRGPGAFKPRADADSSRNPRLVIVDGAQGGRAAIQWADPGSDTWRVLDNRLQAAGVTPAQVQVAWVKLADRTRDMPDTSFPAHALWHKENLEKVVRLLRKKYPNLQLAHLSGRTRAYEDTPNTLNPEPIAYETSFAVKWLIENQIEGTGDLNFDPARGEVVAPYLSWGPYLWTDGMEPRSDGFVWECSDTASDGVHPSEAGVTKVADLLLAFYKTNPTTTPWFLKEDSGQPPAVTIAADVVEGPAPLTVQFSSAGPDTGTIDHWAWNFDDGGFSLFKDPLKHFPVPGEYEVRLTVTDSSGSTLTQSISIAVTQEGSGEGPFTELLFAQFGNGSQGGMSVSSRITLINLSREREARVIVEINDSAGDPMSVDLNGERVEGLTEFLIPANGAESLKSSGTGLIETGSVTVTSETALAGFVLFDSSWGTAGVGASRRLRKFVAPMEASAEVTSGVAVMGLGKEQTLQLELRSQTGEFIAAASLGLAAKGQVPKIITEFEWDPPVDFSSFDGSLTAIGSEDFAATVIRLSPGEYATLPVVKIN